MQRGVILAWGIVAFLLGLAGMVMLIVKSLYISPSPIRLFPGLVEKIYHFFDPVNGIVPLLNLDTAHLFTWQSLPLGVSVLVFVGGAFAIRYSRKQQ
jgi:hypothetical protein